jgi:hypothetical protein
MMTTKKVEHTPGPWTFEAFSFGTPTAPVSHKKIVGPVNDEHGSKNLIAEVHMNHPAHDADGRLLASAPDMLEALEAACEYLGGETLNDDTPEGNRLYEKMRKVIEKAKGNL